ncbi:hypothetical protein LCGC14_0448100 [marine sediment metagenome]|uniref:HD domain-containing protein n=1 Tax=marine sediment metagenome TaxID=412755 RepID=A0A0F9SIN4_9ZZZZ
MTKAETIFAYELSLIHDTTIKQFVITCFDKLCPDYFWTCPCSTTGKYHPQVSLGIGGLVRHTKLAVWWGLELIKALHGSPELKDIALHTLQDEIIATLLLHDMIKNGKGLNTQGYPLEKGVTGTHGVTLAKKINDEINAPQMMTESYIRIVTGIALHMGIWTTKPYNATDCPGLEAFAQLIHLADYAASRKVDDIHNKLEKERTDDIIKKTADFLRTGKIEAGQGPPCPGVRKTESFSHDIHDFKD